MNVSRSFLLMGSLYLLVGILLGMYMGGSGDHALASVHAHINLLGFTLMTMFGLAYHVMPALARGTLAKAHFWLHQVGAFVMLVALFLLLGGKVAAASIGPIMPFAEGAVLIGMICWAINLYRNAK